MTFRQSRMRPARAAGFLLLAFALALPAWLPALAAPALPAASAENALRHVTVLSRQIGPRPSGTPAYLRASEYVEGQLRTLGYQVQRQPFTFLYFESRGAALRVVGGQTFQTLVLEYSAATSGRGIEAPLVYAGLGRREEIQRAGAEGRVVLVQRGELTFAEKVENAAAAGAVGAVIFNNQPGPVRAATLASPSRIPAVTLSLEDGERLQDLLRQGSVRVHLRVDTLTERRMTWNIIGGRPGRSRRTIVIGGHLDSVEISPGANDNASGIAAALEAARLLASSPLEFSVEIISFGGEERGLLGSVQYLRERGSRVAAMVNMDMVGWGTLQVGNGNGNGPLVELAGRLATRLGLQVPSFRLPGPQSDHYPFERSGIPVVFIHTGDDPLIHTPNDTLERLDARLMAQAAQLATGVALEAAGAVR